MGAFGAFGAFALLLDFAFDTLRLHRVAAELDPRNERSIALCRRLGMVEEAHYLEDLWFKGAWADSCGAKTGSRLVAVDGVPLEGRTAAEVRRVVSLASRPLWLDIVGGPSPKAEKLAGEHMLL